MMRIWFLVLGLTYSCIAVATTKVTLWNAHNPSAYLDAAIQQFEQSHDVLIEKNNFLSEKLREEVLNQARTKTLPDILYVPSDFVGMHDLIYLSPVPKDWLLPTTDARVLGAGYTDGHQYGIPLFQGNHLVLYYNKSLVKQPVDNWSQLLKQQSQFSESGLQTIVWNYSEMYWFIPFLTAFNGWPIDNGTVTLDTPEMRKALSYYKQLKDLGLVDPKCDHDCSVQRFKDGEAGYMINGDWIYNDLKQNMGEQLGVSLLPMVDGNPMLPMFSGYVLSFPGLSTSDSNYEQIKSFALYMQSNAAQDIIYREGGLLPANVDVLKQQTAEQTENDQNMSKQMGLTKAMPSDKEMTIVWLAIQRGFNRYLEHHYSIEQATQLMQKVADKEVAKLGSMK